MDLDTEKGDAVNPPRGLSFVHDYLDFGQQQNLLKQIDTIEWISTLKRRVQHYGWIYDYRARHVSSESRLGPLPVWLQTLAAGLSEQDWFKAVPDQVIVNEYKPGQGIAAHVDCEPCFGDTIASISLGSGSMMNFQHRRTGERRSLFLNPGSLLVMSGEARFDWTHAIPPRKTDLLYGERVSRSRRVSLTFRTVNI